LKEQLKQLEKLPIGIKVNLEVPLNNVPTSDKVVPDVVLAPDKVVLAPNIKTKKPKKSKKSAAT
jgi:hypothetical protein